MKRMSDEKLLMNDVQVEDAKVCLTRDVDEKNINEEVSMMSGKRWS